MASNFQTRSWTSNYLPLTYNQLLVKINNDPQQANLDLFVSMNRPGVFLINGTKGSSSFYPVYCSAMNIKNLGIADNVDNAYLVYPGFGIQLYYNVNYDTTSTSTYSNVYYNTSNAPVVMKTAAPWTGALTQIKLYNSNNDYAAESTSSLRIFFRGAQVDIDGLTN
jgi:hypothetical protein